MSEESREYAEDATAGMTWRHLEVQGIPMDAVATLERLRMRLVHDRDAGAPHA